MLQVPSTYTERDHPERVDWDVLVPYTMCMWVVIGLPSPTQVNVEIKGDTVAVERCSAAGLPC